MHQNLISSAIPAWPFLPHHDWDQRAFPHQKGAGVAVLCSILCRQYVLKYPGYPEPVPRHPEADYCILLTLGLRGSGNSHDISATVSGLS